MAPSLFARVRIAGLVIIVGASACSLLRRGSGDSQPAATAAPAAKSSAPRPKIKLNDADVAAVFLAANYTDVSYAQVALAPGRTTNKEVIDFANRMLADHGGLNKSALELFANANITPRDNVVSLDFRDESAAKRDTLRERTGAVFDSTYMANEVRYHTRLLDAIDSLLLPSAKNSQLQTMLTRVRPAVAAHLEHATRVQAGLGK
jgi:putative membrane protein